jgi:hypothetical protein
MNKGMPTAIVVWVVAVAAAVVVIRQVENPMRGTPADHIQGAMDTTNPGRHSDVSQLGVGEDDEYFVATPGEDRAPGVTEMQRPDDLVIGPGTVTHPAAKNPRP